MLGVIKKHRKQLHIKCFLTFMKIINNVGRVDRNSIDISTSKQPEYVCVHGNRLVCPARPAHQMVRGGALAAKLTRLSSD